MVSILLMMGPNHILQIIDDPELSALLIECRVAHCVRRALFARNMKRKKPLPKESSTGNMEVGWR